MALRSLNSPSLLLSLPSHAGRAAGVVTLLSFIQLEMYKNDSELRARKEDTERPALVQLQFPKLCGRLILHSNVLCANDLSEEFEVKPWARSGKHQLRHVASNVGEKVAPYLLNEKIWIRNVFPSIALLHHLFHSSNEGGRIR